MQCRPTTEVTTTDYSLPYGYKETKKKPHELSEDQKLIVQAIEDGWLLFRNNQTFKWYMKKEVATPPFRTLLGTLYKPSVQSLLEAGLIKPCDRDLCSKDQQFILK